MRSNLSLISKRCELTVLLLAYYFVQSKIYQNIIAVEFSYIGFVTNTQLNELTSFLIVGILSLFLRVQFKKPSDFFNLFIFLNLIIPLEILMKNGAVSTPTMLKCVLCFLITRFCSELKFPNLPKIELNINQYTKYGGYYCFAVVIFLFFYLGTSNFSLQFEGIYYRRDKFTESIDNTVAILVNICFKVVLPMIFIYSLKKRKIFYSFAAFILFIIGFGITSFKFLLFLPILLLVSFYYSGKFMNWKNLIIGIVVVLCLLFCHYFYTKDSFFVSLLVRRPVYLPCLLIEQYHDYYGSKGHTYWFNSFLNPFLNQSEIEAGNGAVVIGNYSGLSSYANTGIYGTGFMHAGLSGMILYSFLVGLLLSYLNSLRRKGFEKETIVGMAFTHVITLLSSSDFPVTLITHGLLLFIILIFLFSNSIGKKESMSEFNQA